ncbi:MAG: membrane dipeptidase [Armatimonadetes bacterium]|nr:membrane dipeptidase [Armatimonadota bacterium]
MPRRNTPSLTPEDARRLHREALVIDTQQPPATTGLLFTEAMRAAVMEHHRKGMSREDAMPLLVDMAAQELVTSSAAREQYLDVWNKAGVTVACGTYSGSHKISDAYDMASKRIAQAHAIVDALDGEMILVRRTADIERARREGKRGLILDFQNTTPYADNLERINHFHNLGVRMVQLTYNLRNLVGDGCTEASQGGLSTFGREVVRRLNETRTLVDVSHCSEQVGWDALKVSAAPIVVSHSASKAVCYHDRGKTDELAKAVADRGGFFGVVVIAGFISESKEPTLDDFCRHVEHLVNVCGIDHVGIGTDKAGPGPGTESLIEYPKDMPKRRAGSFGWDGFRDAEHRITPDYHLNGFEDFRDWPNLTTALARWGFDEEELRKLLGLNFLRVFKDVVG